MIAIENYDGGVAIFASMSTLSINIFPVGLLHNTERSQSKSVLVPQSLIDPLSILSFARC